VTIFEKPDMAIWPLKLEIHISISGNVTDSIKIKMANIVFLTMVNIKNLCLKVKMVIMQQNDRKYLYIY